VIRASGLHKAYGPVVAVEDVSFSAADGRITGMLGPNGAGKTTTLRILYTIVKPDRGTATVGEHDVATDALAVRREIGVLPDGFGLYPRLTSREHIRYFGRLHGLAGEALEAAIDRLVLLLDMADIADRRAEGFSHGQRLKVALARALVHEPGHLLLDEPTNGLDVLALKNTRAVLRRIRDEGRSVLFSSHVMQEVAGLCDDVVVIAGGRVVAEGTPESLRAATGASSLEDAFLSVIGSAEGLVA
jgi:sodium transport system ATP-binding protein